jgi:hypothetical protein
MVSSLAIEELITKSDTDGEPYLQDRIKGKNTHHSCSDRKFTTSVTCARGASLLMIIIILPYFQKRSINSVLEPVHPPNHGSSSRLTGSEDSPQSHSIPPRELGHRLQ